MTDTGTAVGQETLSYCTSCRMDLGHMIVAMKGDKIVKVECKTCKKSHNYRAPKGNKEPAVKKKRAASAKKEVRTVHEEWERLMASNSKVVAKPYATKASFGAGDRLSHPSFGEGYVQKLIYPNKLEVIFQNEVKVLIHAGAK